MLPRVSRFRKVLRRSGFLFLSLLIILLWPNKKDRYFYRFNTEVTEEIPRKGLEVVFLEGNQIFSMIVTSAADARLPSWWLDDTDQFIDSANPEIIEKSHRSLFWKVGNRFSVHSYDMCFRKDVTDLYNMRISRCSARDNYKESKWTNHKENLISTVESYDGKTLTHATRTILTKAQFEDLVGDDTKAFLAKFNSLNRSVRAQELGKTICDFFALSCTRTRQRLEALRTERTIFWRSFKPSALAGE